MATDRSIQSCHIVKYCTLPEYMILSSNSKTVFPVLVKKEKKYTTTKILKMLN